MKFAFIAVEKAVYPVEMLCSVLEVSRSGYYAWCKRPPPPRAVADARLAAEIAGVHQRSRRTHGSPRVHADLRAKGLKALRQAVAARRPPRGLVHHSDRGSPYASTDYRNALEAYGMKQSMSRKADCWDAPRASSAR